MSFFDKFKGKGQSQPQAEMTDAAARADRAAGPDTADAAHAPHAPGGQPFDEFSPPASPMEATARMGQSTLSPPHSGEPGDTGDSSIISEAAPS